MENSSEEEEMGRKCLGQGCFQGGLASLGLSAAACSLEDQPLVPTHDELADYEQGRSWGKNKSAKCLSESGLVRNQKLLQNQPSRMGTCKNA